MDNILNYNNILKYYYYYKAYLWIDTMLQAYADERCLVTESEH